MANKKKWYVVFDCETATLPFANEIAGDDVKRKKRIAIAKPLIYDMGWTVVDRQGNIKKKEQVLIAETFSVPSVFNTAYYREKRPIYLKMLEAGETKIRPWKEAIQLLLDDLATVDAVGAFNSMFDFKKALPFTELYINKLYSANYYEWEKQQRFMCKAIAEGNTKKDRNPNFEEEVFRFRGHAYPLFDLWGLATTHLLNNSSYKKKCLEYGMITNSGTFFKSSAESSYRYLCKKYGFIESHTALDDAIIESFILSKIAKKHAIDLGIKFFPFRDLGYTDDYCKKRKKPNLKECEVVYNAIAAYIAAQGENEELSNYTKGLLKRLENLAKYMGRE